MCLNPFFDDHVNTILLPGMLQDLIKQFGSDAYDLPPGALASFKAFADALAAGDKPDNIDEIRTLGLEKDIMAVE